jgi:peptidoglycan biosynthesis protein MviN/MurJ (putative lipid II flippase)
VYSWTIAIVNLVVSVALTPLIGLDGVAIGTTAGYLSVFPAFMRFALRRNGLSAWEFARVVWLPAYGTGAVLAGALLVVRGLVPLNTLPVVLGVAAAAVLVAWLAFYAVLLSSEERAMFRRMVRR